MDTAHEEPRDVRRQLRVASVVLALVIGAAIVLFTLSPAGSATSGSGVIDAMADVYGTPDQASWVLHAGLFGLLGIALALWFATSSTVRAAPVRSLAMLVLALWIFAAATELGQLAVEGRDATLGDWIADMVGALLGLFVAPLLLRRLLQRWWS
jgi:VanZ family protein